MSDPVAALKNHKPTKEYFIAIVTVADIVGEGLPPFPYVRESLEDPALITPPRFIWKPILDSPFGIAGWIRTSCGLTTSVPLCQAITQLM